MNLSDLLLAVLAANKRCAELGIDTDDVLVVDVTSVDFDESKKCVVIGNSK